MSGLKRQILRMQLMRVPIESKNIDRIPAAIKSELFHLQFSIDCLTRILNGQDPYPGIDMDEVF